MAVAVAVAVASWSRKRRNASLVRPGRNQPTTDDGHDGCGAVVVVFVVRTMVLCKPWRRRVRR